MTDRAGPSEASSGWSLRAVGFALTGAGALVAGTAALLDWITVTFPDAPDAISPTERGIDLVEGSLVLVLCAIALIAVLVTRVGAVDTSRRGAASVVFLAGIALAGIALGIVASADRRFVGDAVAEIAELGEIDADAATFLDELLEVRFGLGVWFTLAGGLLTAAGGLATLRWASRRAVGGGATLPPPPPPPAGIPPAD